MQCAHCNRGQMRLLRFDGHREIYGCRQCGVETRLLDCILCERRSVRQLPDAEHARWACHRCQVVKHRCPRCDKGWVQAAGISPHTLSDPTAEGYSCDHCRQHWQREDDIA